MKKALKISSVIILFALLLKAIIAYFFRQYLKNSDIKKFSTSDLVNLQLSKYWSFAIVDILGLFVLYFLLRKYSGLPIRNQWTLIAGTFIILVVIQKTLRM